MEKMFILWIWYYHKLPTVQELNADSRSKVIQYNRLYKKYKDSYADYFNIDPDSIKPSKTECEYVIGYYERRMRNVNTSL